MNYEDKTYLFFDASGGYTHIAEALVGQVGAIKYFCPWETAFPTSKDYLPGSGLDGIERVHDFFDELDSADLVVFPDVGNAGLQEWLRRRGMPVFGSGAAEKLERDRWFLKSVCKKYGIDCADAVPVKGLEMLRQVLETPETLHVKLSRFRGDLETFKHSDWDETQQRLAEVHMKMGPYANLADFVVEKPIDGKECVEVGADVPATANGVYPDTILWGYEVKDKAYGGITGKLPPRVEAVMRKLQPILSEFAYRGPFSTETRETEEGSFFLDATCRFPEPPSSLQRFLVANWAELMWECAHGRVVEPEYMARVGVQIILKSEYGADHPLAVKVGRPDRVTLHGHCNFDGRDYAVSPSEIAEIGAAVGYGNTLTEAMEEAIDAADSVKGRDLGYDAGALEDLTEQIQLGNKLGIKWE